MINVRLSEQSCYTDKMEKNKIFFKKKYGSLMIILAVILFTTFPVVLFLRSKNNNVLFPKRESIAPKIKNVVLINIDSLRADYIGSYGNSKKLTPFLDSLFAKGVVFENAITPAYLTFQTNGAIFSGIYPSQNNVTTWYTTINENLTLLPGILKLNNYKTTALVNPSMWEYFGWAKQFDKYTIDPNLHNIVEEKNMVARYITNAQSPFFFFWHIYDVHQPYLIPEIGMFPGEYGGQFEANKKEWIPEKQTKLDWYYSDTSALEGVRAVKITDEDRTYLKASYESGIKNVDQQLQFFFESIQNSAMFKDTLFIISSEHGDDMNEHGYIFHRDLYDVNIHVPLVFIHPSLKPQRIKSPVSSLDILPTVLGILNIPISQNIEGVDLSPIFKGGVADPDRSIFSERPPFDEYSVRKGDWKYILRNPDKKTSFFSDIPPEKTLIVGDFFSGILSADDTFADELYNISKDPYEQNNLIGKSFLQEKVLSKEVIIFRDKMRNAKEANKVVDTIDLKFLMPYP